ncbi:MAG: MFS transporter [Alphaproteobacteria bacterium]|nr:MFS transporter [Alphaproteobacteria bacterium]MDI9329871.1 MFS transporter [Alphaproteobacteria bacterium]
MRSIALICAGALLAPLDSSVNVAFVDIVDSFAIEPGIIIWVILPYVIAQSLASLLFGRLGDLHGHRWVFAWGMTACVFTHWAITLSTDYGTFVIWRAIQGAAVGMAVSCAPALVAHAAGPAQVARSIVAYTAVISCGMILGPLLGGWLVHLAGWQGVYLYRVAVSLAVLLLIPLWLPPWGQHGNGPHMGAVVFSLQPFQARHFVGLQMAAVVIYFTTFTIMLWGPFLLDSWPDIDSVRAGFLLTTFPAGALAASLTAARGPWPPGPQHSRHWVRLGLWGAAGGLAVSALAAGGRAARFCWPWPLACAVWVWGVSSRATPNKPCVGCHPIKAASLVLWSM